MNKNKKTVKTKEELIETYTKLKKQKNSWWNVLASEQNSIKTIFGGFLLYIGYLIVVALNIDFLLLLYSIMVIAVIWYWVDMLRTQYEKHQKEYQKKMRVLNNDIRRWNKKKIVVDFDSLTVTEKRTAHIVQTILPYIWGYAPEFIEQEDLYQYNNISIASIKIKQEQISLDYWFLAAKIPQKFEDESTAIFPKPFVHDKWKEVRFNEEITKEEFRKEYTIHTSLFMHSYYLISKEKIDAFFELPTADKWLVFRKNTAYLVLPKKPVIIDILALEQTELTAQEEAQDAIKLGEQFWQLLQQ